MPSYHPLYVDTNSAGNTDPIGSSYGSSLVFWQKPLSSIWTEPGSEASITPVTSREDGYRHHNRRNPIINNNAKPPMPTLTPIPTFAPVESLCIPEDTAFEGIVGIAGNVDEDVIDLDWIWIPGKDILAPWVVKRFPLGIKLKAYSLVCVKYLLLISTF